MNEDEATPKKKSDKTADGITVSLDKTDKKEKSDTEEPKPRIVLTFRSEKSNTKSANMKIVSTEEKQEEVSPRRSSRTRGKWDWVCDSDTSISPKKDKSQPVSENDESDSSHAAPKRTRRRSRDDNILASAIARKEKYNETSAPTQRLSRRIKPTAKILANEELRMGLESQNNARLGIQAEKSPEEGVRTRRSARPATSDAGKKKAPVLEPEVVELDSDSQNSDMKLQHLCKLGLKAIDPEEADADADEDKDLEEEDETELFEEEEEEIDDDSEVISKLLEADEETAEEDDDEFLCTVATSKGSRPRRSTRLCSGFGAHENDRSSPVPDEAVKGPSTRRSARKVGPDDEDSSRAHRTRRKRRHSEDELVVEAEIEEASNPAGAEEGTEAACPEDQSTIVAKCFCEMSSNVYAEPKSLTEPVFCQAIETVEGVRVGCSHPARRSAAGLGALLRAGPRAPYALLCELHAAQLAKHMCCPACGLYCSQGIFYQCSEGHLFHLECGLPHDPPSGGGCPHCGVHSYRWQPANTACWKVQLHMASSNKRVFLPDQREQCTQAYLGFTALAVQPEAPSIPEDLLPSAAELKLLCSAPAGAESSPEHVCDAILRGERLSKLIPIILSCSDLCARVESARGGSCVHAAARCGHAGALHALHEAGAPLDALDRRARTPLLLATLALLDKAELKPKGKSPDSVEAKAADDEDVKDEDLLKVIRYLVAAGADVQIADQEGLTALHVAARHGSVAVCRALLQAGRVEVDAADAGGWTPLVWAAENGHTAVVRLLLAHGASPSAEDKEGNSAVHWCALSGAHAALQVLLEAGAGGGANAHTDTPLHIAARQGHYACVVTLLARGARSDVENSAGELPIDVASGACERALALNMQMRAHTQRAAHCRLLLSDISNGREPHAIPCVNEIDDTPAPSDFTYVTHHVTPYPVSVDCTIQSLQGCACAGGSCGAACPCVALGVQAWWRGARLAPSFPYHEPPMLFQCNATCRCNPKVCTNSVISRLTRSGSVFVRCEVYRVGGGRGWGLRASAAVPRGAPVAAYTGELLPLSRADTRAQDTYMFALDVKQDLLEQGSGSDVSREALCVDAARYGGAARFMNHSCAPNVAPVRVYTATRDLRLPTVALQACRDIAPGEQLTFDYGDKFWSVKCKSMKCECGAPDCRYPPDKEEAPA